MAGSWNGMEKGQQRVTQSISQAKPSYLCSLTLQQPVNLCRDRGNVTINIGHDSPLHCGDTLRGHHPQERKQCWQASVNAFPVVIHSGKSHCKCKNPLCWQTGNGLCYSHYKNQRNNSNLYVWSVISHQNRYLPFISPGHGIWRR